MIKTANIHCIKFLLILLIRYTWVILPLESQAQPIQVICKPAILHFSNQVYNAHRQNWGIAQDTLTKFMYFANSNGLLENDGSNWKLYPLPQQQKVRSVAVDRQGRIFTGALGEFGYWSPNLKGTLTYHSLNQLIPDPNFPKEEIWNILPTSKGILFQSFAFIYLYQNNQIKKILTPGNVLFVYEVNGRLLLEVIDKGLYELKNETFTLLKNSEFLGKESVHAILPTENDQQILVGSNKGLYLFDGNTFREFNKKTNLFIQQNQLNCGIRLDDKHYAFGTIINGIIITDENGEILQRINQKNGLQNNTVLSFTKDDDGNLWIGMDKGIDLILLSSPIKYYDDLEGDLGTVYDVVLHQGKLYLGTNHGLFVTDLNAGEANFQLIPRTQGQVWDLKVFDNQLICGHNNGTFLINGRQANLISTITGGWVIKALKHHPELLLQGTYTKLCIYQKGKTGQWQLDHTVEGFSDPVRQLEEDGDGNIWLNKASNGLNKLQLSADTRKITHLESYDTPQLRGASVNLCQLNNQLLLTTNQGILTYNPIQNKFIPAHDIQQQLGTDIAYKIFPILEQGAFVWKQDGILSMIQPHTPPTDIPIKINQWVDDLNILSVDSNNFVLCTEKGFAILPKKSVYTLLKSKVSNPMIRSVSVADFPELSQSFLTNNLPPSLSFRYDQNNITIGFSTPDYSSQVKYSFWLENSTKKWSPFLAITQREFDNLSPGKYVFHLKSNLGSTESQLAFEIKPPWYWNVWSKIFYFMIAASSSIFSYRLHIKRLHIQQERIRKKLEKKLKRQEEHSAHEIMQLRNHQLEQDILRKSEELANSTMSLIKKNELLLEIKQAVNKMQQEPGNRISTSYYKQMLHLLESNISTKQDWQIFEANFNEVHAEFLKKLTENYPDLTPGDLKLAAYLRMNLSTKEIAQLLNITTRSVELKRYRLRKKLGLDTENNLGEFMIGY